MQQSNETFHIEYNRWLIKVERLVSEGNPLFRVHFLNEIPDLTIERETAADGNITWKPVPTGMEEIANEIGALIEQQHLTNGQVNS